MAPRTDGDGMQALDGLDLDVDGLGGLAGGGLQGLDDLRLDVDDRDWYGQLAWTGRHPGR